MLSLSFRRTSPLGAACVLLLALSGCHDGQGDAPSAPLPEVGVATVVPRTVRIADEFNGRVEAVDAVELRPRVSGYLQRIRYKEGDLVAQGAVLFEIDPRPYRIARDRAIAQQQRARAAEHLARVQLQRVQTLIDAHATSQEELDNARAAAEQARADLQAADAAVADAKLNLGFTEVRAPIGGRVGRALATAGNLARADDTLLTTVVSQDPVYVYFDCDEQSYLRYNAQRADPAHRAIGADPVRVGLANETGFPHAGTVDFLDNRLDPQTGTIRARVRLPNADHTFTPGLYARVQLVSGRERSALLVDDKAVLTDQDRKYVYVIGPGDKALRRDVTIGRDLDGQRIVEKGLNAGDRVVVDGVQRIYYPGAQVKPKPQAARADAQPGGAAQAVADAGAPAAQ
ncbi:efflux RND transporter periplasmic adaptor subunit [Burkholderia multivorans]|uniref:efflux RND transporter periplasmic adaptor subunit n=1 Tax=Burkholderia multivorans TaxID=87883 RepID=UPI001C25C0BD|nr:efflux RND transporter periplasmic adaptor subunit [Burkholderia multivorans]MBU9550466.1 efflux RND transporter periplasmic adaptor subunit [Burkholderia multivorans]